MVINTFAPNDLGNEDQIEAVKARFNTLDELFQGAPVHLSGKQNVISAWFRTCELVRRPGRHHLLCLSVRNLENPRETMGIELYFDSAEVPLIFPITTLKSLRQRADDSRMLIEGWDNYTVTLPSLGGLLEAIGGPHLEEIMAQVGTLERWRLAAVQHHIGGGNEQQDGVTAEPDAASQEKPGEWINLYEDGNLSAAEDSATRNLLNENERHKSARLYNDRGYIRYGLQKKDEAKRDLQRALDLHFFHLPITLSNLGVAEMDNGNYEDAIELIRDAMFLTLSAEDVSAAYLRLRLPPGCLARKVEWEQHPGNVLEASYINLSFAYLQIGRPQKANEVLEEGLALMPSSIRLKHALARLRLSHKRADLAEPIYRDIAQRPISDSALANEIRAVLRTAPRTGSRRKRNK